MKTNFTTATRLLVALLALGVMLAPTLLAGSGDAATVAAKYRKVSPPNVFYPVIGTRAVRDLQTYRARHQSTDIKAPCGVGVFASHPGVATVWGTPGHYLVRIVSSTSGVRTYYNYLARASVASNQVIQSGQVIGTVGRHPRTHACDLSFSTAQSGHAVNPTSWLNYYVGRTPPVGRLFDAPGFNVASFNILGASHTVASSRYATYAPRLDKAMALWNARRLDVVGTQEFQENTQWARFTAANDVSGTWGSCYWDGRNANHPNAWDTENALLFRNSTMELVPWSAPVPGTSSVRAEGEPWANTGCENFNIKYFNGQTRRVPVALLREKATGRTAFFMNVHNPADVNGPAQSYRNEDIAIEKRLMIALRTTGRPVFLTGDLNDRQAAFCPLTANMLSITPNSVPSTTCRYPGFSIDWIFAAGQARFSYYVRDTYPQSARISDHPIIITRAHLQN